MRLNSLTLRHFRNYDELQLPFAKDLIIFLGENAQGKTNLLESIYVLAMTRSHRTTNEQELIEWDCAEAYLAGVVEKKQQTIPLELGLSKKGRKTKVNHIEQKKLSSYIGQLNVILFAPEDLSLVKGTPQLRRKFLDMEIGQIDSVYLYNLVQYQQVLKQRNQYLKQLAEKKQTDPLYLDILTEQLVTFGSKILWTRINFIKIGPHRDELVFFINGKNVQTYGSQGQQRTTALSVKLAEIDLMKAETGEYPILLLDDVMSELDDSRQVHLLEAIEGKVQTFLTTTTLEHVRDKMTVQPAIYYVNQGKLEGEKTE